MTLSPDRRPTRSWSGPAELAAADRGGLQFLLDIGAGRLPVPPIVGTLGVSAIEVEHGRIVSALTPAEARVTGGCGRLLAHATSTCLLQRPEAEGDRPAAAGGGAVTGLLQEPEAEGDRPAAAAGGGAVTGLLQRQEEER